MRPKVNSLMDRLVILTFMSLVWISIVLNLGFSDKIQGRGATRSSEKHTYIVTTESFFISGAFPICTASWRSWPYLSLMNSTYLGNSILINLDMQKDDLPQDMLAKACSMSLNE